MQYSRVPHAGAISALVALVIFYWTIVRVTTSPIDALVEGIKSTKGLADKQSTIQNATLGFQKIFVLGMPERTDKRDQFALAARMSNMSVDYMDGVDPEKMSPKAIPDNWNHGRYGGGTLGCWRVHMDVAQRMMNENIQTALVMEDDADWDILFRAQLTEFANGARFMQESSGEKPGSHQIFETGSPYGDDWDVLWFGHCGTRYQEDKAQAMYVTEEDPTAVPDALYPRNHVFPNFTPDVFRASNFSRTIIHPRDTRCTFGYAISQRGAKRSLYMQSVSDRANPSDKALNELCINRYLGFRCLAPFPALLGTFRPAGKKSKDSDRAPAGTEAVRERPETASIIYSTRQNLDALVSRQERFPSQWQNQTMYNDISLTDQIPQGRGIFVEPSQLNSWFKKPIFGGDPYYPE